MAKARATIRAVFDEPTRADVKWSDIESALRANGAEISEGRGSRVRVALKGVRAVFHRPQPRKEAGKAAIRSVRRFLIEAGVKPC